MCKILLSINKEYSDKIFSRIKTFELRRKIPKENFDKVLVYTTSPISKVNGEFTIRKVYKLKILELWELTKNSNGISKELFFKYFEGLEFGFAIEIENAEKYKKPKLLKKLNINYAPQNFVYVK